MQYSISGPGGRPGENKTSEIHLLKFQLSKHCLIKPYIPNETRKKKYPSLLRKVLSGIRNNCHLTHSSPNDKPLQKQHILLNDMFGVQRDSENAMLQLHIL